eukprot:m.16890 g.16890  ORF g.16890 m.16890 type:complete len:1448 (+) comp7747_c0_seq1:367-4710(+)
MAAPPTVQVRSQTPHAASGSGSGRPQNIAETIMGLEDIKPNRSSRILARPGDVVRSLRMVVNCERWVSAKKKDKPDLCCCGRMKVGHSTVAVEADAVWSMMTSCKFLPTNTYGRIEFLSSARKNSAVFVRTTPGYPSLNDAPEVSLNDVASSTATLIEALMRSVNPRYKSPNLLLSVTGAAQNFSLPARLTRMISAGLQRATSSTDAWVITGGTHAGVMKLTGEIMNDMPADSRPPLIGIATWGILENRDTLCGRRDVTYSSNKSTSLDHNHQAFVLVDDGRENEFGGEIPFRAMFEASIADRHGIPAVTLVIQGGPGTVNTCYNSVMSKTPLVVIEGTGQAADCIAYAWMMLHSEESRARAYNHAGLLNKVREVHKTQYQELTRKILETVSQRDMVVVFSLEDHGKRELDHAILTASLTANKQVEGLSQRLLQAMTWDRLEIARKVLAARAEDRRAEEDDAFSKDINKSLMHALKHNNPDFVELYIEYGAKPHFLKPTRSTYENSFFGAMQELYENAVSKPGHVPILFDMTEIGERDTLDVVKAEKKLSDLMGSGFKFRRTENAFPINATEDEKRILACNILLIWAVTLDKFRLAQQFWRMGDQCIPNALIASALLDQMADRLSSFYHLADEREKMMHNARKFEELAVGVLQMGFHANPDKVAEMLEAPIVQFNNQTALEVAAATKNLMFISNQAAQSVINSHWYGKISPTTTFPMIIATILMPFNVWWIKLAPRHKAKQNKAVVASGSMLFDDGFRQNHNIAKHKHTYRKKLTGFFNAPFVRFWIDMLAFLGLLCLHSYVTLTQFDNTLSAAEYVLLIWFISLTVEEGRQLLHNGFFEYLGDSWNRLDATIISLYTAGFLYRISNLKATNVQVQSKAIFAINSILLFWRLARYYAVSSVLGPKLIMMKRMAWDVLTFSCLILIFLFGYGIAAQSILFPTVPFDKQTILGSLYRPYFQIYGELFLDEMNDESSCIGQWPFSSCDAKVSWLIPILVGLYLLITNILLINLLIAFMNQTYVEVQEQSRNLWNRQNLELYFEYKHRPLLPAPFILLSHLYKVLHFIWHKGKAIVTRQKEQLTEEELEQIRDAKIFQAQQTERYLKYAADKALKSNNYIIVETNERVNEVLSEVSSMSSQQSALRQTLERRQNYNTSLLKEALKTSKGDVKRLPQIPGPQLFDRSSLVYPFSSPSAYRIMLTDKTALWNTELRYNPTDYTCPAVLDAAAADPANPSGIAFNTKGSYDRTSCEGAIKIGRDGRPLNPRGRTGICGRGELYRWGPNHAVDVIVTRWKTMQNGSIMEREGHRVMEYVCMVRRGENMRAIPGGFLLENEEPKDAAKRIFLNKVLLRSTEDASEDNLRRLQEQAELIDKADNLGAIYMHDWRNTDNAWVESTVFHIHDEDGMSSDRIVLNADEGVMWMVVHTNLPLFANHQVVLDAVCAEKQASW